jgi:hypothetical protein
MTGFTTGVTGLTATATAGAGTWITPPHFLHLNFFPAASSGTRYPLLQLEHTADGMKLPGQKMNWSPKLSRASGYPPIRGLSLRFNGRVSTGFYNAASS